MSHNTAFSRKKTQLMKLKLYKNKIFLLRGEKRDTTKPPAHTDGRDVFPFHKIFGNVKQNNDTFLKCAFLILVFIKNATARLVFLKK
jgi:hypothetical protein